jgi:hypothetical protein
MTARLLLSRRQAMVLPIALAACGSARPPAASGWTQLVAAAPFPGSYGFPVHVADDGRFVALHPRGAWASRDGVDWARTPLSTDGVNHSYRPLVRHAGATWTFGRFAGDYQDFALDTLVRRTRDYRSWEVVGEPAALPRAIFPAIVSFHDALWMFGGTVEGRPVNAAWRSIDGLAWTALPTPPWSPRARSRWFAFRDRLWLIGGGEIDGPIHNDIWSSADGVAWRQEAERLAEPEPFGFTPQVFAGRVWLVGANRAGGFSSGMLVSGNGRDWQAVTAPWSPRGMPAVWTDGARMYLTGGKYSQPDADGEPQFLYSNDVWAMTA